MNFAKLSFGNFDVAIIGLFWAIAFGYFCWQIYQSIKKEQLDPDFFVHHFWRWTAAGIIGGRLFILLLNPDIWEAYGLFSFFAFWEGKINVYIFLFSFLGFMWWDMKTHTEVSFWAYLDVSMIPFLQMAMLLDIAFFMTGSLYGKETSLPWGVQYETFGVELISPLHPITIYALILHFILYKLLQRRRNALKKTPGRFFMIGMIWFVLIDFLVQFLRFDQTIYVGFFRMDQFFAVLLLGGFIFLYHRFWGLKGFLR